jgi:hypothetical protein
MHIQNFAYQACDLCVHVRSLLKYTSRKQCGTVDWIHLTENRDKFIGVFTMRQ